MIVGYTTGVFDMFHVGHLNLLEKAREHCDTLIVGISSDSYVMENKGKTPIIHLEDRKRIVSALSIVDKVADYFTEDNDKGIPIWESNAFANPFRNPESGTHYNFENNILLWYASKTEKYDDIRFITAKQGFDEGL